MHFPTAHVAEEFGADTANLTKLSSGRGTAWLAGEVVLKPLDMALEQLEWQAEVLASIRSDGVRVAAPLRSRAGELVSDGWTAWPRLAGDHHDRWPEILSAGAHFHEALAAVPRPGFLDRRQDRWARADRVAWGEAAPSPGETSDTIRWLLGVREAVSSPSQLVHGDLSGNVLFADGQPPAVIDVSPYWRPRAYASAIVVVDAIAWSRAGAELMTPLLRDAEGAQMLVRALLFRLLSDSDPEAGRYPIAIDDLRRHLRG